VTSLAYSERASVDRGLLVDEVNRKIETALHFPLDLFTSETRMGSVVWTLRPEIFEAELVPFLDAVYMRLYPDDDACGAKVLEVLRSAPSSTWRDVARKKSFVQFQFDEYGEVDSLQFEKPFRPTVEVRFDAIILSLEGKVATEGTRRHFNFLKWAMMRAFGEYRLSGALRFYITG
jgi:hypothetical protein